jgi:hypothetical protein
MGAETPTEPSDAVESAILAVSVNASIACFHLARGKKRSLTMSMARHLEAWKLETGRVTLKEAPW